MVKPVYTPLSLRDWVRVSPRHPLTRPGGLVCCRKRSRTSRERLRQLRYVPVSLSVSKRTWMLFWSSSASSCSRSHMAACSSASRASSFSSSVRLWLLINRAIMRSLLLFVHLPLFSVSTGCRVDPDQVVIVRRCGRRYYNCTSCPVFLGRIMAQHIN